MIVVPDTERESTLDATMAALGTLKIFLFVANVTPDGSTVIGDLSAGRPSWADPITMTGLTSASLVGHVAKVTWDDMIFTNSTGSPVNIYGYAVQNSGGTILRWSERNGAAPVSVPAGGTYTVKPYYSRISQP